jgi:hypothetical protein
MKASDDALSPRARELKRQIRKARTERAAAAH